MGDDLIRTVAVRHTTASKGKLFSWSLFDFANTGFNVIIMTVVFPTYFTSVIAGGDKTWWGLSVTLSMIVVALIGPVLGAVADAAGRKKLFLGIFTALSVAATAGLYGSGPGTLVMAMILVIVANAGFEGGTVFYDAFLPELSSERDYARVSGFGFAMGYFGSFFMLGIAMPLLSGDPPADANVRLTFLLAAIFFAVFALPMMLWVPERTPKQRLHGGMFAAGIRDLRDTFSHIRRYRDVVRFLLAFFIYNDAILTVVSFAAIFAAEVIGMDKQEQIIFFMVVQTTAIVGSLVFGQITNRLGARRALVMTLFLWVAVVIVAYFVTTPSGYFIVGTIAGIGLGSSQSTSRALMALLTPWEKRTEFFGFYDGFFGKASAVVGPAIFGILADAFGMRIAMFLPGAMFLIGMLLLLRVPDVRVATETIEANPDVLAIEDGLPRS